MMEEVKPARDDTEPADFIAALSTFYEKLAASQEPLGREFEEAWSDNIEELYES